MPARLANLHRTNQSFQGNCACGRLAKSAPDRQEFPGGNPAAHGREPEARPIGNQEAPRSGNPMPPTLTRVPTPDRHAQTDTLSEVGAEPRASDR
jgi:hypothetical protein